MNQMQKILSGAMLVILLGFLLYPEWNLQWTCRLDYRYYYDADVPAGRTAPSEEAWQEGFELAHHKAVLRHWIVLRPKPQADALPPPKSEFTGTGAVKLGQRHTSYVKASITESSVTLNRRKMAWETFVLLIPAGMFAIMFRDRPRRLSGTEREKPRFIS